MKKSLHLVFILIFGLAVGCTIHVKPPKFDVESKLIQDFKGESPIRVVVPENADKEFKIGYFKRKNSPNVVVDLNKLYHNAEALMEEQLAAHRVPMSPTAQKFIKFSIIDVQWEHWAGGFAVGSYLDFEIATADGYTHQYRVQDGSASNLHRAVGGTVSRAVERIFQDKAVLAYIAKRSERIESAVSDGLK